MPVVLVTPEALREQPGPFVDALESAGFRVTYPSEPILARGHLDEQQTIAELSQADATIASGENYSETVIEALPRLRVIARCGVGYDRVQVTAASQRGIPVTITPQSNREAVAELALALMFAVSKSIVVNDRQVRSGHWPRMLTRPLRGCTLGLIGLGRIGRSTAERARALGMSVVACETHVDHEFVEQQQIEIVELNELLARSDFLSLHCPLIAETRGIINRETLGQMKASAVLINTARGGLVVEQDLIDALQDGTIFAAGLDVYAQEPPAPDNPLLSLDNVVLSPHIAGCDEMSMAAMASEAADCIIRLFRGDWPDGAVVNDELRPDWRPVPMK